MEIREEYHLRQREKGRIKIAILITALFIFSSCVPGTSTSTSGGSRSSASSSYLTTGYGYILPDSPNYVSSTRPKYNVKLSTIIDYIPYYITDNSTLRKDCFFKKSFYSRTQKQYEEDATNVLLDNYGSPYSLDSCFEVYRTLAGQEPLYAVDGKWNYNADSDAFMQVSTYYHSSLIADRYLHALYKMYNFGNSYILASGTLARVVLPTDFATEDSFWYSSYPGTSSTIDQKLKIFSRCTESEDPHYSLTDNELCFPHSEDFPGMDYAEDVTIIYHEFGHFLTHSLMNLRNTYYDKSHSSNPLRLRTTLGTIPYDEGRAINEGLSDYYSYYINGRNSFGDWALAMVKDNMIASDRPIDEDHESHSSAISTTPEGRLSYPDYLYYDANYQEIPIEGIHYAGQISSHFLVALTKEIKENCGLTYADDWDLHRQSTDIVLHFIANTLAEQGDLTTMGHAGNSNSSAYVNLYRGTTSEALENSSYLWATLANPLNYRTFFQVFSKNAVSILPILCPAWLPSLSDAKDFLEPLLDDYGLLLFSNYNFDGNDTSNAHTIAASINKIDPLNRQKSVLITKNFLDFSSDESVQAAYVVDSRSTLRTILASVTAGGIAVPSDNLSSTLEYNNGNGKISPGEMVGVALNLYNHSNSPLVGVQILGNDWDHTKKVVDADTGAISYQPCQIDGWPTVDEGGIVSEGNASIPGNCDYVTRYNGQNSAEAERIDPVCLVQYKTDTETTWVTQDEYLDKLDGQTFNSEDCLFDDNDKRNRCLVNVMQGLDQAVYSKLDSQENYLQTLTTSAGTPSFSMRNLIFLEVSKGVPPGTIFNCRFRARFTNCSDCYDNPNDSYTDDYADYEYSGATPFKVLNFQFIVID